jgi:outer membrane protein assembly factor BamB
VTSCGSWSGVVGPYIPALADGTLLVASRRPDHRNHASLLAVDTATHVPRWRHAFNESPQVVVGDGRVVVLARRLTALRLRTGVTEWTSWHENAVELRGADGVVYVEDSVVDDVHGYINRWVALRARDGAELRVFKCNDLIVADGHVFTTKRNRVAVWGPPG